MYFKITTEGYIPTVSDFLYYEYYDNIESVAEGSYLKYYTKSSTRSSTSVNGVVTSSTSYFTITKKAGELDEAIKAEDERRKLTGLSYETSPPNNN